MSAFCVRSVGVTLRTSFGVVSRVGVGSKRAYVAVRIVGMAAVWPYSSVRILLCAQRALRDPERGPA